MYIAHAPWRDHWVLVHHYKKNEIEFLLQYQEQTQVVDVIMAAVFEALGSALRWQDLSNYEEHLAKVHKARRRLARSK